MVYITHVIGFAACLSGLVSALPRPQDSAIGEEVAVSAPNGIPLTDTVELASQLASETQAAPEAKVTNTVDSNSLSSFGGSASVWTVATTTSSAWSSYNTPIYGSGNSNWGGSSYNDCVSQCLATYGAPAASYLPSPTSGSLGSSGSGATHTVIVAPTQGVLRYVPFAVNASVGDTIEFMWRADNHTVTKSSALLPCNKSSDALFASGIKTKDFVFTQVVNDTNPTYFFCAVPTHCQKGMFGIINPPSAAGSPSSFSNMIQPLSTSNPDISAYASYVKNQTTSNNQAARWGGNINLAALPEWAHSSAAENILYTRNFLANNPEVLKDDGSIDLGSSGSTPIMFPLDVTAALNNAGAAPAPSSAAPVSPSSTGAPSVPSGEAENLNSGARSLVSSRALVGLVVVIATFLAL
jgi:plastocyanin